MREYLTQNDQQDKPNHNNSSKTHEVQQLSTGSKAAQRAQVLQLQRQRGNAYVRRMLSDVQRQDEGAPAADAAAPTMISDGGATVTVAGGVAKVSAPMLQVNAAMADFAGIVKSNTLITNSVISSSYTPGAGNIE